MLNLDTDDMMTFKIREKKKPAWQIHILNFILIVSVSDKTNLNNGNETQKRG